MFFSVLTFKSIGREEILRNLFIFEFRRRICDMGNNDKRESKYAWRRKEELTDKTLFPSYPPALDVEGISHKISKILVKKWVEVSFKPLSTLNRWLPPLKDYRNSYLEFRVYKVLFSCGIPYIGKAGCSFVTRQEKQMINLLNTKIIVKFPTMASGT